MQLKELEEGNIKGANIGQLHPNDVIQRVEGEEHHGGRGGGNEGLLHAKDVNTKSWRRANIKGGQRWTTTSKGCQLKGWRASKMKVNLQRGNKF